MHWPYADRSLEEGSDQRLPNVYADHIEVVKAAERLGFDTYFLTEHHFTDYNLLPSPNVFVGVLAQHTQRIRLGVMCNVVPFHDPLRLAEESAMLDCITNGRLELGFGRGVDEQEFLKIGLPFEEARPRFEEGMEIITAALKQPRFRHEGRFWKLDELSIRPRPIQKPHPPIWITAISPESARWVAERGYQMASSFVPLAAVEEGYRAYREAAKRAGHHVTTANRLMLRHVYVGESAKDARRVAEPAMQQFLKLFFAAAVFQDPNNIPQAYAFYKQVFGPFYKGTPSYEDLLASDFLIAGDADYVRDRLLAHQNCVGHLLCFLQFGYMTQEDVLGSMERFAKGVLPALQGVPPKE